jgi:DNA modification methylase
MKLLLGDCLNRLKELPDNSVDSIVTDPPYGLSFMDKKWDYDVPSEDVWRECLRVLKPGGHLLAFAGTRTQHRMAVRIEDAGFEIRDMIAWIYGSGFPKSHNIGKAVDKLQGNEREVVGKIAQPGSTNARTAMGNGWQEAPDLTKGTSPHEGWGTALKPALEPITVARKPLIGTVASNVLEWGTGGINVDGCRVGTNDTLSIGAGKSHTYGQASSGNNPGEQNPLGRFPANLIHDGSEEVVVNFPNDNARFFYCAKASKKDRDEGLEGFEAKNGRPLGISNWEGQTNGSGKTMGPSAPRANSHPTVKPTDLMRYLCRLVTPPGGTVLDPFMGSGSTGKAALLEGFDFIGIEMDYEYYKIAHARIHAIQPTLLAA